MSPLGGDQYVIEDLEQMAFEFVELVKELKEDRYIQKAFQIYDRLRIALENVRKCLMS